MPLLHEFDIDVVRFGPSERNEEGVEEYVLMRSFESMAVRDDLEGRFYGSKEWQSGLRDEAISMIEHYHTIVLTVPRETIEALGSGARAPTTG